MPDSAGVVAEPAHPGRLLVARLLPGSDVLEALRAALAQHDLGSGCILTMLGSLSQARFVIAVPDDSNKAGIRYGEPKVLEGPLEFLGGSGTIGVTEAGKRMVHLHVMLCDQLGKFHGGHLLEEGNIVLTTLDLVVQEFVDVHLVWQFDEQTGFSLFKPQKRRASTKGAHR